MSHPLLVSFWSFSSTKEAGKQDNYKSGAWMIRNGDVSLELFQEISDLITEPTINVSSFELTHSNLVHQLLCIFGGNPMIPENRKVWQEFLHVFFKSPPSGVQLKSNWVIPDIDTLPILKLVQILQNCVNQSEQFPARSELGSLSGSQQFFRFINNHQLKCQLVRHPSDKQSKEWKKREPLNTFCVRL